MNSQHSKVQQVPEKIPPEGILAIMQVHDKLETQLLAQRCPFQPNQRGYYLWIAWEKNRRRGNPEGEEPTLENVLQIRNRPSVNDWVRAYKVVINPYGRKRQPDD